MNEIILNPYNLYLSMQKRGWEFDNDLKEKYINIFKKIKNNEEYSILNKNEKKLFSLFDVLKIFNKDYSYYILIITSLEYTNIKNLFRYLIIKWV